MGMSTHKMMVLFLMVCWWISLVRGQAQGGGRALFVFGDSLVDSGNNNYLATSARADLRPYGIDYPSRQPTGRFSNGLNIPDFISKRLGVQPVLPYLNPAIGTPNNLVRGANFASAGVGILNDTGVQFAVIIRMAEQLELFREYQNRLATLLGRPAAQNLVSNGLVSITLGGNDYVNNYYLTPISARSVQFNLQDYTRFIVSEYKKILARLYELGGRRIMVAALGPLGCAPSERALRTVNGGCDPALQRAAVLFNSELRTIAGQLNNQFGGSVYTIADSFGMIMNLVMNPNSFGFVNSQVACCGQGRFNGIGTCNPLSNLCPNRNSYVFWDAFHPTERANRMIVDRYMIGSSSEMYPLNLSTMLQLNF